MKNPRHILLYMGGFGIGKSSLCAALVPWALSTFVNSRFWTEKLLLERLRNKISDGGGDYMKELSYMIDDQFVIYDDFGSTGARDWRKEVLGELVDQRWASNLPTVFTSNLNESQIDSLYGGRLHSRLFDKRNIIISDFESQDQRSYRT
jgi:DNA replication protein DnaC